MLAQATSCIAWGRNFDHAPITIAAVPDLPATLRAGLDMLRRAIGHFLIVAHRYEMYQALARDLDLSLASIGPWQPRN